MISLFFWKLLNFNVKEKLLLKPETTPNKEISGPPYAFLICVRKPHEKKKLETNFNVKEKLLLKPETTPNKEISGPPYASLICVRKPHQIQK